MRSAAEQLGEHIARGPVELQIVSNGLFGRWLLITSDNIPRPHQRRSFDRRRHVAGAHSPSQDAVKSTHCASEY
ncbi:hypothetical protein AVEN_148013-1, partial [Araneus ventricosus]